MSEKILITKSKLDTLAKKIVSKTNSRGKKTIDELGELVDGIVTPSGTIDITSNGIYDVTNFEKANVEISGTTQGDMLQTKVDNSNSCAYLFYEYIRTDVDFISNLDTSSVINMQYMFAGCRNLITIPTLDTSSVTNMRYMFNGCSSLTTTPQLDTSSANIIGYMFYNCSRIYKIDISYFNISSTSNSGSFAQNCYSLKAIIIRGFGTNYVLNSTSFNKCYHILGTTNSTYNPTGAKDGYIYVPRNMIDTLSSATNWSTYASQLRALEDYTVDGTTTGAFDDTKAGLNGSTGGTGGGAGN